MRYFYLFLSLLVFSFDRWTKALVIERISPGESTPVIRNFLHFAYNQNPGIAFGLFGLHPGPYQNWILIGLSLLAIGVVATLAWKYPVKRAGLQLAFALIVGGAGGNLWDRVLYGQVTDFIDVFFRDSHWPVFNIADSAISVGVSILAIELIFFDRHGALEASRDAKKQTDPG
jgi:signal peptidase II